MRVSRDLDDGHSKTEVLEPQRRILRMRHLPSPASRLCFPWFNVPHIPLPPFLAH